MIQTIFCYLADLMKDTGLFNEKFVYEYVQLVRTASDASNNYFSVRPKYYKGKNDGYIDVHNWDVNGTCYFRKTDRTTVLRNRLKFRGCSSGKFIEVRFPIRFVAAVPKTKLDDSPFCQDQLCQDLIGVLQGNYSNLAQSITAHSVEVNIDSYQTDPEAVWNSEIKGVAFSETVCYNFAYISIDFTLIVKGDSECLQTCLNNVY